VQRNATHASDATAKTQGWIEAVLSAGFYLAQSSVRNASIDTASVLAFGLLRRLRQPSVASKKYASALRVLRWVETRHNIPRNDSSNATATWLIAYSTGSYKHAGLG